MSVAKITVKASKEYDVIIGGGIIENAALYIKNACGAKKIAIITDDNVDRFYGASLEENLRAGGFDFCKYVFPHGEESKNLETIKKIYDFLINEEVTRSDCIAALGGGVTGDIAGFAAATYLRGIKFIQIPTSLLAQVDSSVGGKTGVDLASGKNLVGAFKQPELVLCDINTLSTLPQDFFIDGMGEVIKYGMIKSGELFNLLEENDIDSIRGHMPAVIERCVSIKRDIVIADEFDNGERMLLNFGHTLGHAIEKYYDFKDISHGKAIAAGMRIITGISERDGESRKGLSLRLENCLERYGLNERVEPDLSELTDLCLTDKKRESNYINIVLCRDAGESLIKKVIISDFIGKIR